MLSVQEEFVYISLTILFNGFLFGIFYLIVFDDLRIPRKKKHKIGQRDLQIIHF